jgi:glutathione synthase/RimK-type ligase-like ATP-grasp enzyme
MKGLRAELLRTRPDNVLTNIERIVEKGRRPLLIPTDDAAIRYLHDLYRRLRLATESARSLAGVITRSIGDETAFSMARKKTEFISLAREEGVLVPECYMSGLPLDLLGGVKDCPLPAIVKQDDSFSGRRVRYVETHVQMADALLSLRRRTSRSAAIVQSIAIRDPMRIFRPKEEPPKVSVQQYIEGTPANRLVLCRDGKVLAGLSVEVLQTLHPNGPASVVRLLENCEMEQAVIKMVRRLRLSGFAGFDFMLDRSGKAYLLEMNMRPTQIAHLAFDRSTDLIGALSEWLLGRKTVPVPPCPPSQAIALFPEGIARAVSTSQFRSAHHDVPRHLPELMEAYGEPAAEHTAIARASPSKRLPYRLLPLVLVALLLMMGTGLLLP